jgi:ribose-phosphate pyrophosphokinase
VEEISVIGEVEGRHVVIIDDLVDTAGTLTFAATVMKDRGALSVRALATHPVLSGDAVEKIEASPLLELVVTDSIPLHRQSEKIKVLSVSEIFAEAIKAVYTNSSISTGFVF